MAKVINFDAGVQEYEIGGAVVKFNPTDFFFAERVVNVFDKMDALQQQYQGKLQAITDDREVFNICRDVNRRMMNIFDDLFQADVSTKIFGGGSLFAIANGLPVWANCLFAVMDEIDATIMEEQKKTSPRLEAYLKKYQRS